MSIKEASEETFEKEVPWNCSRCGSEDFYIDKLVYNKIALICKNCLKRSQWVRNESVKLEEDDE